MIATQEMSDRFQALLISFSQTIARARRDWSRKTAPGYSDADKAESSAPLVVIANSRVYDIPLSEGYVIFALA